VRWAASGRASAAWTVGLREWAGSFLLTEERLPALGRAEHLTGSTASWAFRPKWPDTQGCFEFGFIFFFPEAYLNDILMKFV
jgi:hypothetical protein